MTDGLINPRVAVNIAGAGIPTIQGIGNALRGELQRDAEASIEARRVAKNSVLLSGALATFQQGAAEYLDNLNASDDPDYSRVPEEIANIGLRVQAQTLRGEVDGATVTRFTNSFGPQVLSHVLQSVKSSRERAKEVQGVQIRRSALSLADMAVEGPLDMSAAHEADITKMINGGVMAGIFSPRTGAAFLDETLDRTRRRQANQAILMDPKKAIAMLEGNVFKLSLEDKQKRLKAARDEVATQAQAELTRVAASQKESLMTVNGFIEQIKKGAAISDEQLDEAVAGLAPGILTPQAELLIERRGDVRRFAKSTPQKRLEFLRRNAGDPLFPVFQRVDMAVNSAVSEDALAHGVEQGLINTPLIDLSFDRDISGQLMGRVQHASFLSQHYGRDVSLLTKKEATRAAAQFAEGTTDIQSRIMGEVVTGAGSYAESVFRQIATEGSPKMGYYGALLTVGDSELVSTLLQGDKVDEKLFKPDVLRSIKQGIRGGDLPAYADESQVANIREAAFSYYKAKTKSFDNFSPTEGTAAIQAVTGGPLVTYNGNQVEPAKRGQTTAQFRELVRSVTTEEIEASGGLVGVPRQQWRATIRQGTLVAAGRGNYYVVRRVVAELGFSTITRQYLSTMMTDEAGKPQITRFILRLNNPRISKQ